MHCPRGPLACTPTWRPSSELVEFGCMILIRPERTHVKLAHHKIIIRHPQEVVTQARNRVHASKLRPLSATIQAQVLRTDDIDSLACIVEEPWGAIPCKDVLVNHNENLTYVTQQAMLFI